MSFRWSAFLLMTLPPANAADLRFLNGDGGPLPAHLEPVAAAFSRADGDFTGDAGRAALAEAIVRWANAHDHPVFYASVDSPDRRGLVTVRLTDGMIGHVTIEGGAYLPVERIARGLRLQSGAPLNGRELQEELDWLQRNSFYAATLAASPGATAEVADIAFTLSNERPVSFLLAYDNQGVAPLGESRYRAAVQWGHAFGLDQQLALLAVTAQDPEAYRALAGEWLVPLPWRHEFKLTAAWAATQATDNSQSQSVDTEGSLWAASLRYNIPFRINQSQTAEVFAGFDYRKFDTDLTFGGSSRYDRAVEVGAFVAGASWRRIAGKSTDAANLELVWSPGGMFSGADDAAYEAITPGADSRYFLVRGSWLSMRMLSGGWQWMNKAGGQAASSPLLPSEDYNIAGASAVRGYSERSVRGRHAATVSTEILTPALPLPGSWQERGMAWQFAVFVDGGWAAPSTAGPDAWLAAAGAGIRARAGRHFIFTSDVAWPLHEEAGSGTSPRFHVAAQLNF